jgi:hypothetical protein
MLFTTGLEVVFTPLDGLEGFEGPFGGGLPNASRDGAAGADIVRWFGGAQSDVVSSSHRCISSSDEVSTPEGAETPRGKYGDMHAAEDPAALLCARAALHSAIAAMHLSIAAWLLGDLGGAKKGRDTVGSAIVAGLKLPERACCGGRSIEVMVLERA